MFLFGFLCITHAVFISIIHFTETISSWSPLHRLVFTSICTFIPQYLLNTLVTPHLLFWTLHIHTHTPFGIVLTSFQQSIPLFHMNNTPSFSNITPSITTSWNTTFVFQSILVLSAPPAPRGPLFRLLTTSTDQSEATQWNHQKQIYFSHLGRIR